MTGFLIRRIGLLVITLLITSAVIFLLTQVLPGDTARLVLGRDARPEAIAQFRAENGLDLPLPMQYVNWLTRFVTGDWGTAFTVGNAPIRPLVLERLGNSLKLAIMTGLFSVPISILLGVIAGLRENKRTDVIISVFTLSVVGLPEFVTGLILINTLALGLDWFPTASSPPGADILDWFRQLTLPALSATFVLMAYIVRMTRAGVVDELKKPYVRTAALKGLSYRTVIVRHVLRNALLPTITVIALSFGWMVGGLIVIENVFNYPGLGRLMTGAVERKDLPLLQASVMMVIFFFASANLIADLLYGLLNPRIRLE
ncbi:MAG: ABC transporter permease [Pleurocapsa minor GSE-CHR-MK-17-07R]|jgi:peptide/nickel transport system permease protein|nr:ABC transporter permease [Pleurocapsa minor GSE-CHR-MK 17-07R]